MDLILFYVLHFLIGIAVWVLVSVVYAVHLIYRDSLSLEFTIEEIKHYSLMLPLMLAGIDDEDALPRIKTLSKILFILAILPMLGLIIDGLLYSV